ncbi:Aspartate racemase [Lentibacillus sp. JNUCC-1]|uniref:aspartate/glutamate racemase family protein n=1 Tax=Lentibacillus sp. JNUCC-1 TaxID=2654513 RepID=UPI0012E835F0|nr:amino acid racemase [Lentibacillus sp. JNUCC-1]MUV39297.1 Aspartate racemase [Lentibacillus sp. JNUCC-1]
MNKKLGIIGGMGPKATASFMDKIINYTEATKDQDHIDMVILNHATLPDRTKCILNQTGELFLQAIQPDIHYLESAGVDNIAIPCNTSHYYYEELQAMTDINIIHMVQETTQYIQRMFGSGSKVAILATDGTIASGVYENQCKAHNLFPFVPDTNLQKHVMNLIYNIKADATYEGEELDEIIQYLVSKEKCTSIILGCTELSTVSLKTSSQAYCIDPMNILVEQSIIQSGKQLTQPVNTHFIINS